jgi:hypothetical protein
MVFCAFSPMFPTGTSEIRDLFIPKQKNGKWLFQWMVKIEVLAD